MVTQQAVLCKCLKLTEDLKRQQTDQIRDRSINQQEDLWEMSSH